MTCRSFVYRRRTCAKSLFERDGECRTRSRIWIFWPDVLTIYNVKWHQVLTRSWRFTCQSIRPGNLIILTSERSREVVFFLNWLKTNLFEEQCITEGNETKFWRSHKVTFNTDLNQFGLGHLGGCSTYWRTGEIAASNSSSVIGRSRMCSWLS